jgi:uncharacterized protein YyaL (SSP411 family)
MASQIPNALIHETSTYLLQHAYNPVAWHPWNEHTLLKAIEEDKPILLSIGYAACHWCHVMERESFEDANVAAYMNTHFINIKVDREERPDLDHIYMDALQVLSGQGGWPLNIFLTDKAKPFYGGTYFPPKPVHNRPSWMDVLYHIADAWANRREEVLQQADKLISHIEAGGDQISKLALMPVSVADFVFVPETCMLIKENLMKQADIKSGGFGKAPKFPQTFSIRFLLGYAQHFKDARAINHARLSLSALLNGGIYDQLAGGMARYSTDNEWLVPHFEKMLYDNALLITALCDAYQISPSIDFETGIRKSIHFCKSHLKNISGGYYAAIDADSEGVEGKFYIWDKAEIDILAGTDAAIFNAWFGVVENGNWEGQNILHITHNKTDFTTAHGLSVDELDDIIARTSKILLEARQKRVPPISDDKIILGWNALYLIALCRASAALEDDAYTLEAIAVEQFITDKFYREGVLSFHTYTKEKARHPAYLDDFASLINALIALQEVTGDQDYIRKAMELTSYTISNFWDAEKQFFYYTHIQQQNLVTRKLELYDGATSSGNSSMAENLRYLSIILDKPEWAEMSRRMITAMKPLLVKYPGSFAVWARLYLYEVMGYKEWIITGRQYKTLLKEVNAVNHGPRIIQASDVLQDFPLLQQKKFEDTASLYYCSQGECYIPVKSISELDFWIKKKGTDQLFSQ